MPYWWNSYDLLLIRTTVSIAVSLGSTGTSLLRKNILSIDDHPIFSSGLKAGLEGRDDTFRIHTFSSGKAALAYIDARSPVDLILLDLMMPAIDGRSLIQAIRIRALECPIIILSGSEDIASIKACIDAGANGMTSKNASIDEIHHSVSSALEGKPSIPASVRAAIERMPKHPSEPSQTVLSKRQREVLKMIQAGLSNQAIATVLHISELTVKAHLRAIFRILGVSNRVECVRRAESLRII